MQYMLCMSCTCHSDRLVDGGGLPCVAVVLLHRKAGLVNAKPLWYLSSLNLYGPGVFSCTGVTMLYMARTHSSGRTASSTVCKEGSYSHGMAISALPKYGEVSIIGRSLFELTFLCAGLQVLIATTYCLSSGSVAAR